MERPSDLRFSARRGRARLLDWILRYGPAELGGFLVALVASVLVRRATGNAILAAYAAAWGETGGYAAVMVVRDLVSEVRAARSRGQRPHLGHAGSVAAGLLTEFGPAGVIDSFLTRPLAMAVGVRLLGPVLGLVAGKLMADALFYIPVIYVYERRKHRRGMDGHGDRGTRDL